MSGLGYLGTNWDTLEQTWWQEYTRVSIHYILDLFNLFAYDTSIFIETQHGSTM